jgi:hypothetical protein
MTMPGSPGRCVASLLSSGVPDLNRPQTRSIRFVCAHLSNPNNSNQLRLIRFMSVSLIHWQPLSTLAITTAITLRPSSGRSTAGFAFFTLHTGISSGYLSAFLFSLRNPHPARPFSVCSHGHCFEQTTTGGA